MLHAVRLLGFADEGRVAARFALERGEVLESLEDFEAVGWCSGPGSPARAGGR